MGLLYYIYIYGAHNEREREIFGQSILSRVRKLQRWRRWKVVTSQVYVLISKILKMFPFLFIRWPLPFGLIILMFSSDFVFFPLIAIDF